MQIIPDTGQWIATQLDWPNYQNNDVYRPYINVAFGTYYLSWVMQQVDQPALRRLSGVQRRAGQRGTVVGHLRAGYRPVCPDDWLRRDADLRAAHLRTVQCLPGTVRDFFRMNDPSEQVAPTSRDEWRQWLNDHHTESAGIWLIFFKKNKGHPTYEEAVEEGLCFGWIDSITKAVDEDRQKVWFSPRKAGSGWAKSNKERIAKLIEQGLMTAAGLEKIEAAKQDGSWTALDSIDALIIPGDLQEALATNAAAQTNFEAFPPSAKKNILWWIQSAKRPETRQKRITETVTLAAQNRRANQP